MEKVKAYRSFEENLDFFLSLSELSEVDLTNPIAEGKWSTKEIIGHIYYWDKFIIDTMIPNMEKESNLSSFPDHDLYNEKAIPYISKYPTTTALINEFEMTRRALLEKISTLDQSISFTIGNGKRNYTPESFINMFVKHDLHHIQQIKVALNF
ncbi:DinB family protein [Sutcliffiella halmapala]|uniref:DinB family protein n=1 Tax=Sutcliffiella halmapala TaxID=79882 RepID=UPI0009955459|nr:DinB family protein [Sutcliffiella halmapala]